MATAELVERLRSGPVWRRRRAAARLARDGSPEAVTALAAAFVAAEDPGLVGIARGALTALDGAAAVDAVCEVLIATGDDGLQALVEAAGYAPSDPGRRALLWYLTGHDDRYAELDVDGRLLAGAHRTAEPGVRARLVARARTSGHVAWVDALAGVRAGGDGERHDGWDATVEALAAARQWARLWHLVLVAPPSWSARILARLDTAGWLPPDRTERHGCTELVALARRTAPLTAAQLWAGSLHRTVALPQDTHLNAVAISPDGRLLAVGGGVYEGDGLLRLYRLPDGAPVAALAGHTGYVGSLAFSPDGELLASGSNDGTVRLWRATSGHDVRTIVQGSAGVRAVAVAFSPDGALLAASSYTGTVRLWRPSTGERVRTIRNRKDDIRTLAFSPDGAVLAAGGGFDAAAGRIRLWRPSSGEPPVTLPADQGSVVSLAFSPDGTQLACGSGCGALRVYRFPARDSVQFVPTGFGGMYEVTFSRDGSLLVSAERGCTLRSPADGEPLCGLDVRPFYARDGSMNGVSAVAVTPDGSMVVTADRDRTLRLCTSTLAAVCRTPVEGIAPDDLVALRSAPGPGPEVTAWVELVTALVRWRRRHEVEIDAAPETPDAADVELGDA